MQYRSHRYQTTYPITLHTRTGTHQAQVIDVNANGARITGVQGSSRGDKIQISILNQRVDGVVRWATHGMIGIVFRPALTDHQVDTLRYRRDARAGHGPGRVGFRFTEMR